MAKKKLTHNSDELTEGSGLPDPIEGQTMDFLSTYKRSAKNLPKKRKPLTYIKFSQAVKDVTGFPGFPKSSCISIAGYSDTGKTTLLLEQIIQCQKDGVLPIIISTEGKFSFEHAKFMGMDCDYELVDEDVVDVDTGEVKVVQKKLWNKGFFMFKDGFENSEEMYKYIIGICKDIEDPKVDFPYDVCFFVDSLNKLKCKAAMNKIEDDDMDLPMHNAKTHKNYFSGFIEPFVTNSIYADRKRSITFVAILRLHAGSGSVNPEESGGMAFAYDMSLKIFMGGMLKAATQSMNYEINGQTIVLAKTTKISILKNHITGVNSSGTLLLTPHGFIPNDKEEFAKYKKENKQSVIDYFQNLKEDSTKVIVEDE